MEKLTVEDRIMGRTEPLPPTELQLKAFTDETKYLVYAEGNDNKKVVTGISIGRILSLENKQLIANGELVIKANGLVIERIVEPVAEKTSETDEQLPKPKRKRTK